MARTTFQAGKLLSNRVDLHFYQPFFIPVTFMQFLPYILQHLVMQPYRSRRHLHESLGKRAQDALVDGLFHVILEGYEELTNTVVSPETGVMLSLLMEFSQQFDAYVDTETNLVCLDLDIILQVPSIREAFLTFRQRFDADQSLEAIMGFLRETFITHADRYLQKRCEAQQTQQFESMYQVAQIDSGIWTSSLMRCIEILNHHPPHAFAAREFYYMGMACKFIDDAVDLLADLNHHLPNLLAILVRQHSEEHVQFERALAQHQPISWRWWRRTCPETTAKYIRHINSYYSSITSPKLRLACDILMLKTLLNRDINLAPHHRV